MIDDPALSRIEAVVIGASAGGVEALGVLLPALPPQVRASIFVVVHLRRERPSLLPDLFAPRCRLPVREVEDKQAVEPGTIYFAPPDYHLLLEDGPRLALSVDDPVSYCRPSIDVLFESASDVYGERLMAIVLTGGNSDGAQGLAAVHRAGGLTVVQDPQSAQARMMPESALETGAVDSILPLDGIAELLGRMLVRGAA
jgi:two-component system chemotaxis response regulator CheB